MMCERLEVGSANADRPAIRHSKLPRAAPDSSIATLNATCEIVAVPPPAR
jgi:hypothetical protein